MSYDPIYEEEKLREWAEAKWDTVLHHAYCKDCNHSVSMTHKGDLICVCGFDELEFIDGWAHPADYGCEVYDGPLRWPGGE